MRRFTLDNLVILNSFAGSADYILNSFGLIPVKGSKPLHLGARPVEGVNIAVDLQEPIDWGPGQKYPGKYKLVRIGPGKEDILDEGEAGSAMSDQRLGTINFSGKGKILPSYSFCCKANNGIRQKAIRIGGKTADELFAEMLAGGIRSGEGAPDIMKRKDFRLPPGDHSFQTSEAVSWIAVALVDGYDLGIVGEPYGADVRKAAKKRGFHLLPAEAGPHLRLQYMDQPSDEYLIVAMKPILTYRDYLHAPNSFLIRTPVSSDLGAEPRPYFEGVNCNYKWLASFVWAFLLP